VIDSSISRKFAAGIRAHPDLELRLAEACGRFASDRLTPSWADNKLRYDLIGELRHLLARVCVDALQPDLVILDEFQRFKDLLHGDGDAAELARALLSYQSEHGDHVRVLLLSATPYRMLSLNHESDEDHYSDFLRTLSFLFDDPSKVEIAKEALRAYRTGLYGLGSSDEAHLRAARDDIEEHLRTVMVRTERVGSTARQDAMLEEPQVPARLGECRGRTGLDRVLEVGPVPAQLYEGLRSQASAPQPPRPSTVRLAGGATGAAPSSAAPLAVRALPPA
jgi:hypothetical protein